MGKRTAQKDSMIDITSDSQVNSNFAYRWSPASLTFNNYFYLFLYLYRTWITINNNAPHLKSPKNQNRRAALNPVIFRDEISPQPHAEGGEFLLSKVATRGSSYDKIRPDHPLNGLLANDDSGLIEWELTGRKSKTFKRDRTDEKLVKVQQV